MINLFFLTVEKGTDFAHLVICRESLPIKIVTLEGVEFTKMKKVEIISGLIMGLLLYLFTSAMI